MDFYELFNIYNTPLQLYEDIEHVRLLLVQNNRSYAAIISRYVSGYMFNDVSAAETLDISIDLVDYKEYPIKQVALSLKTDSVAYKFLEKQQLTHEYIFADSDLETIVIAALSIYKVVHS